MARFETFAGELQTLLDAAGSGRSADVQVITASSKIAQHKLRRRVEVSSARGDVVAASSTGGRTNDLITNRLVTLAASREDAVRVTVTAENRDVAEHLLDNVISGIVQLLPSVKWRGYRWATNDDATKSATLRNEVCDLDFVLSLPVPEAISPLSAADYITNAGDPTREVIGDSLEFPESETPAADFVANFSASGGFTAGFLSVSDKDFTAEFDAAGGFTAALDNAALAYTDFSATLDASGGVTVSFDVLVSADFLGVFSGAGDFVPSFEVWTQRDYTAAFDALGGLTIALDNAADPYADFSAAFSGAGAFVPSFEVVVDFAATFDGAGGFTPSFDVMTARDFVAVLDGAGGFNAVFEVNVDYSGDFDGAGAYAPAFDVLTVKDFSPALDGDGALAPAFDVLTVKDFTAVLDGAGALSPSFEVLTVRDFVAILDGTAGETINLDDSAASVPATITSITKGVGGVSPSTASVNVVANRYYYLCGNSYAPGGSGGPSLVTGGGITWALLGYTAASSEASAWVFWGQAPANATDTIDMTTVTQQNGWILLESTGAYVSGSVKTGTGNPPNVSMNAYGSGNSLGIACFGSTWPILDNHVPATNWTQIDQQGGIDISGWNQSIISAQECSTSGTNAAITGGGSDVKACVAFEISP